MQKVHKPTEPTKAEDLAIVLLLIERDNYAHILPADYISHFQFPDMDNRVRKAFETNRKITYWIMYDVLFREKPKDRKSRLKFFVLAAEVTRHFLMVYMMRTDAPFAGIA